MNTFDQFLRLAIAIYVDYKNRGLSDFDAEERALQEVKEVSREFRLLKINSISYPRGPKGGA